MELSSPLPPPLPGQRNHRAPGQPSRRPKSGPRTYNASGYVSSVWHTPEQSKSEYHRLEKRRVRFLTRAVDFWIDKGFWRDSIEASKRCMPPRIAVSPSEWAPKAPRRAQDASFLSVPPMEGRFWRMSEEDATRFFVGGSTL
ncbi:hypothetical protein BV25DRAFT_1917992 [Artomyces pyxidatus]|uniref:Uncharacterized protein n=1 Tax=Artomyces pyxidatus TaxID=48021 RepID=A0ACB8SUK0_9AGAM|nr:hypothetical protein BV25DRAFT_1917992 [Artomyces pyxidatus]